MRKWGFWTLGSTVLAVACGGAIAPEEEGPDATSVTRSDSRVDDDRRHEDEASGRLKPLVQFENENGSAATLNVNGAIDTSPRNPFFRSMGTNGRSCGSCHAPDQNWSITPAGVQRRFAATDGRDPIFRTNDGSTSPTADVSTKEARRAAYRMLLTKGLVRVGIGLPANAQFELVAVDDPYGHASAAELSLFRRPLPTTNLVFLTATMWDGRESTAIGDPLHWPNDALGDLATQANDATTGHAQASSAVPAEIQAQIVAFELGLFTAQSETRRAGSSSEGGARGGVSALSMQTSYFGINDVLAGDSRTGAPFEPRSMTLFDAWASPSHANRGARGKVAMRRSIARGQTLFGSKPIAISGVRGVNDALGVGTLNGTCTTCHDAPNVGNHSVRLPLDLGLTDASRRTPDMPLYTLCKRQVDAGGAPIAGTCDASVQQLQTTDPGRALVTGKWGHVATFKGPILRGLSGRAPYFHNGSAATLSEVITFYESRFAIGFTDQEKADLVAFLGAL